jgi:hypothetical protein
MTPPPAAIVDGHNAVNSVHRVVSIAANGTAKTSHLLRLAAEEKWIEVNEQAEAMCSAAGVVGMVARALAILCKV